MPRLLLCAMTIILTLALTPGTATASAFGPGEIDALVTDYLEDTDVPGATVAVVKDDEVIHTAGYGADATGRRLSADSPVPIASLSKSFTALAVSRLADEGALRLDDRVHDLLPEFSLADERSSDITVRQLLNQTSGMSDVSFSEKEEAQPASLPAAVERLADAGLHSAPGTQYHYHNVNFHIAARLVESLSGKDFAEYLFDEVFAPLDMRDSSTVDTTTQAGIPKGYFAAYGFRSAAEPYRFVNGSDGIITTANDLAKWLLAHTSDRVDPLSAAGEREMRTGSEVNENYGLGWEINGSTLSHGGMWFTHSAHQAIDTDTGYGVAVMTNTGMSFVDGPAFELSTSLLRTAGGDPTQPGTSGQFVNDLVMASATLLTLLWGGWRLRHVGEWARRRAERSRWRNILALVRGLIPVAILLGYPWVMSQLANGRTATWQQHGYVWFSAVLWAALAAVLAIAVTATRAARLRRTTASE